MTASAAMTDEPPLLDIQDLSVSYGAVVALDRLSARLPPGGVGLLGPNGAGKTTLLRAMLGFVTPVAGRLRVLGLDPTASPLEVRRRIGYMPESDAFVAGLHAAGFVAYAGELSGLRRDEAVSRAHEMLDYVGLGEARYRAVETFSTGMKQRVKLAQALVHDPELLLLDEPTSGLDPGGRDEMLALLADIVSRLGLSVVLSSHLLPDVERVCSSVLVIDEGRAKAQGPLATLVSTRRAVYSLRLRGDAQAFVTDLRDEGGDASETDDGWRVELPPGKGPEEIFVIARQAGVQVRRLRPSLPSLEDVFLKAVAR
jgi:ABC-2 type transport system ATP-binding protein